MDDSFNYFTLTTYVPKDHVEQVKQAIFKAGAGKLGHYQHCCWQVLGQGQFMPLESSQPYTGTHHQDEYVEEYRIECLCAKNNIQAILAALIKAHPYETPAYTCTPSMFTSLSNTACHDSD